MEKMKYEAPEMEALKIKIANTILAGSPIDPGEAPGGGGLDD